MKMGTRILTIVGLLFFVFQNQVDAQEKKLKSGNSFSVMFPQSVMADTYDHGFGIYANYDYNFSDYFAARFDFGWNDVSGPETTYVDTDGNNIPTLYAGN